MNAPPAIPDRHLRRVWERMTAIYGPRWTSSMGVVPVNEDGSLTVSGDTWAQGLSGLTPDQIAHGLRSCLATDSGWPPTLPEFRAKCVDVPPITDVRAQLRGEFKDFAPFTLMVYRRLDFWNYRRAETRQAEHMLSEAYNDAKGALLRGEPLPEIPRQLEQHMPAAQPSNPDLVAECLATMRRALGVKR